MAAVARLNMNEIPYFSWKGKTLEQITSVYVKNKKTLNPDPSQSIYQIRKAMPLQIYRKEIASIQNPSCSRRSSRIAAFEQPGGSIVNSNIQTNTGLVNILNNKPPSVVNATTITSENPEQCAYTSNCFLSPDINAKRRVRSAGMITKQFKPNYNNDKTYFTSTNEYLVSRNRTIKQNAYVYFREGNSGVQPGTGNAKSNVYSPNGLSHCYQPLIDASNNNNKFAYYWVDQTTNYVDIPDGKYDIDSLNNLFKTVMVRNGHYFTNSTGAKVFLLSINYNNFNNSVILEANPATKEIYPDGTYTPANTDWYDPLSSTGDGTDLELFDYGTTAFVILNYNLFGLIIGFYAGNYFKGATNSQFRPNIFPNYVPLYFKPSNIIFGIQGPVDSSTYTDRVKVNTVTRNGYLTKSGFGTATANAMAYGVSEQPYTLKDKLGFQNTATPVIKNDGSLCCNKKFMYRML
uniref:Uncharacterized protein n=1 Tax=viral metagenome TaxID=1070528 RepID=A0A6C0HZQ2_9ZZZZ